MAARVYQALGLAPPEPEARTAALPGVHSSKNFVPLLFASASMPVETLRTYAMQLERVGGVIAFRGMPGGMAKVGPMAELTAKMLRIDPGCEGPACAMSRSSWILFCSVSTGSHRCPHSPWSRATRRNPIASGRMKQAHGPRISSMATRRS